MTSAQLGLRSDKHYTIIPRVLIFARFHDQVLLLKGAPNKPLWANVYNGVGGHVEPGETIKDAAIRELMEETGLTTRNLSLRGMVSIDLPDSPNDIILFVFTALADSLMTRDSLEGTLEWFNWDNLPTQHIVPDLPALLHQVRTAAETNQLFYALYTYDKDGSFQIQ